MSDRSRMSRFRTALFALTSIVLLLLAGCRKTPARIEIPEPQETQLETRKVELRNCDSKSELRTTLAALVEIEKVVTISPTAVSPESGEQIQVSSQLEDQLISEVERAYQQRYEQVKKALEQVDLVVHVGKIRTFEMEWIQQSFTATIYFSVDNKEYAAEYTYQLCHPRDVGYVEMSCTA